ncbi:MAG: CDP-alcohol phosphatidyltransferase family protein [Clostridia bacterium]|nr:CDP-alcohol phosphatidyltransferase family protein [Clostridia bacterium]
MSVRTEVRKKKERNQNLTVPNAMSVFRILLIPFFVYYAVQGNIAGALISLGLSGLSDALDGFVARKFNQITELGKMLDPFADKLTQGAVAICVALRYPAICPLLFLLVVKELFMLFGAFHLLKNKKKPCEAKWYGKLSTLLFYIAITLIVVLDSFMHVTEPTFILVSTIALVVTATSMIYTFVRYTAIFREILKSDDGTYDLDLPGEIRATKTRED